MQAPLYDSISHFAKKDIYPFFMPGHKMGKKIHIPDILSLDITEIPGFDNLHQARGIILEAEKLAAKTFGADESFFLVNGTSAGIQAAVLSCASPGEKIIIPRNCHISVFNSLLLGGAVPVYVSPEITSCGLPGGINPEKIKNILSKDNKIKAVVITSPTYEGFTSDIEKIAGYVHEYGKILIVDEAHGAHFKFHDIFPEPALSCGADISIQSTHKTLPVLTGSSMLHIKGNRADVNRLKKAMPLFQSTSPSYIKMAVLDYCRNLLDVEGTALFAEYAERLNSFRGKASENKTLKLIGKEIKGAWHIHDIDVGKLTFTVNTDAVAAKDIDRLLLEEFKLQVEMAGINHIIAMTSICDSDLGFDRLLNALEALSRRYPFCESVPIPISLGDCLEHTREHMSVRDAFFAPKQETGLRNALGKISGEFIIPYPPGIPIIIPGEIIEEESINIIYDYLEKNLEVIGIENGNIQTIKEL